MRSVIDLLARKIEASEIDAIPKWPNSDIDTISGSVGRELSWVNNAIGESLEKGCFTDPFTTEEHDFETVPLGELRYLVEHIGHELAGVIEVLRIVLDKNVSDGCQLLAEVETHRDHRQLIMADVQGVQER